MLRVGTYHSFFGEVREEKFAMSERLRIFMFVCSDRNLLNLIFARQSETLLLLVDKKWTKRKDSLIRDFLSFDISYDTWTQLSSGDNDHLKDLSQIQFLVIDEADRMTQEHSFPQLIKILDLVNMANPSRDDDEDSDDEDDKGAATVSLMTEHSDSKTTNRLRPTTLKLKRRGRPYDPYYARQPGEIRATKTLLGVKFAVPVDQGYINEGTHESSAASICSGIAQICVQS